MAGWLLGLLGEFSICSAHVLGASSASDWYILLQGGAKTGSHVQAVLDSSPLITPASQVLFLMREGVADTWIHIIQAALKYAYDFTLASVGGIVSNSF